MTVGFFVARTEKPNEEPIVVEDIVEETPSEKSKIEPQSNNTPSETNYSSNTKTFRVSAYCACVQCCGKSDGITASGVKAVQGITIAADTIRYPFGTKIYLNGLGERVVQDVGGDIKGDYIDLYFENHQDALNFGVQYLEGVIVG